MRELEKNFLSGEPLKWFDIRMLYSNYKFYVSQMAERPVAEIDISPVDDVIMWDFVFNGSSIITLSTKSELRDEEIFSYAMLVGELEYWFYKLRSVERTLSDILFLRLIQHKKPYEIREVIDAMDDVRVSDKVKEACRKIAKWRNVLLKSLDKRLVI